MKTSKVRRLPRLRGAVPVLSGVRGAWLLLLVGWALMSAGAWRQFGPGWALLLAGVLLAVSAVTLIDVDRAGR